MSKILTLTFLFCFLLPSAFSQPQQLILTKEQNTKWIDSLKKLPLDQQLLTINERILLDTNVFVKHSFPDRIKVTDSLGNRIYGEGKPTLIISGYYMFMDNKTPTSKIVSLTKLLSPINIKSIYILSPDDPTTIPLFGTAGEFGIIIMKVSKKRNIKQFKRLELIPNY